MFGKSNPRRLWKKCWANTQVEDSKRKACRGRGDFGVEDGPESQEISASKMK